MFFILDMYITLQRPCYQHTDATLRSLLSRVVDDWEFSENGHVLILDSGFHQISELKLYFLTKCHKNCLWILTCLRIMIDIYQKNSLPQFSIFTFFRFVFNWGGEGFKFPNIFGFCFFSLVFFASYFTRIDGWKMNR